MDCPECGGRLADYRLGERDAVGCEDCGYVGIDAEHRGRPTERESWDDALERFYRRQRAATDGDDGAPDATASGADDGTNVLDTVEEGPLVADVARDRRTAVNGSAERGADDGDDA